MSATHDTPPLREGFTTGTAATAAAIAAVRTIVTGQAPAKVSVPLPDAGSMEPKPHVDTASPLTAENRNALPSFSSHLTIPIKRAEVEGDRVRVTVVKDGGDDPDATHGAEIQAVVRMVQETDTPSAMAMVMATKIPVTEASMTEVQTAKAQAPSPLPQTDHCEEYLPPSDFRAVSVEETLPRSERKTRERTDDEGATANRRTWEESTSDNSPTTPDNPPQAPRIRIDGGRGVGRVTLPGLPVAVGRAAINPVPLAQIEHGVRQALPQDFRGLVEVAIEVPEGETRAQKTLNPRLGIVGGISILGTSGIVKPYSHASWRATITQGLDVARAQGLRHVALTTGRRSERLYLADHLDMQELGCIQAADFFAFSMAEAARRGMKQVDWAVFFGKLVKQAQGLEYTHARDNAVDFHRLAHLAELAGADHDAVQGITEAITARHAMELIGHGDVLHRLVEDLVGRAAAHALHFAGAFADKATPGSITVQDSTDAPASTPAPQRAIISHSEIAPVDKTPAERGAGKQKEANDEGSKATTTTQATSDTGSTTSNAAKCAGGCGLSVGYYVYDFDGTRLFPR